MRQDRGGIAPVIKTPFGKLQKGRAHILADEGVSEINLGTQTAEAFYTRLGFEVVHTVMPTLRHRTASDGRELAHNLVIMSKELLNKG